uniref:ELM2 domain-containing protein n=1 Tax=Caenorhabditis tropicalis TaxID=1561998 RepID=A0A1I7TJ64_9PELO
MRFLSVQQEFKMHEKRLKLRNIRKKLWEEEVKFIREGKAVFKIPPAPTNRRSFRWVIESPRKDESESRPYTVKFAPSREKRKKIPARIYNQKRCFKPRRDARIAFSDAVFQPEKKAEDPELMKIDFDEPEYSEQELRRNLEYKSFFKSWDNKDYSNDEKWELMESAIEGRLEVYQEVFKQTLNPLYLAQAVFIKFLDLNRLSKLHRMYLILTEESDFSMAYVEGVLRRHYE